jgi:hypothetical protein
VSYALFELVAAAPAVAASIATPMIVRMDVLIVSVMLFS